MGFLDRLFPKSQPNLERVQSYFKMLNGYTPVFTTYNGALYEQEITRSAIHSFATHCSKLKPEVKGDVYEKLGVRLQFKPNPFQDTTKFLYQVATILAADNNVFVVPWTDDMGDQILGYYPIRPSRCELMQDENGKLYLRYTFTNGQKAAIEFERVGILNQYQYTKDLFGEDNQALNPTMQLIQTHNQGIIEGVKQSASLRFMAQLANVYKSEDIAKEKARFVADNLSSDNNSGVMLFDNKYANVKQIESKPFVVDPDQMKAIQNNVYGYFGINEKILQNNFTEHEYTAFYEGKIEPFAIQLSLVLSNMTFTPRELENGSQIIFSTSRLDYMTTENKRELVFGAFDRGFMNHNTGCKILGLPERGEDGEKFYIRVEYAETSKLNEAQGVQDD